MTSPTPSVPDSARQVLFWKKVNKSGPCWLWKGCSRGKYLKQRYGQFWNGTKVELAHRYSYRNTVGEIPQGLVLDHICRTTLCVRPSHLRAVTNRENILSGEGACARFRRRTHCKRGHRLGGKNVLPSRTDRECRACQNLTALIRAHAPSEKTK